MMNSKAYIIFERMTLRGDLTLLTYSWFYFFVLFNKSNTLKFGLIWIYLSIFDPTFLMFPIDLLKTNSIVFDYGGSININFN